MNSTLYNYKALLVRTIDGDTVVLDVELGFYTTTRQVFRLRGIDTPEMHDKDAGKRAAAERAKQRVIELLADGDITIRSYKPLTTDKYGRWLAEIFNKAGLSVNKTLLDENLAVPFMAFG